MSRPANASTLRNSFRFALTLLAGSQAAATPPAADHPSSVLATAISRLIESAVPLEYDKRKDWGATAIVGTGWTIEGKPFHWHAQKRRRAVNHGLWQHYRLRLVDPESNLRVAITEVRPLSLRHVAFCLSMDARLDAWARAKAYQYGVHLFAVELECDLRVRLVVEGELTVELRQIDGHTAMALAPLVRTATLTIEDLRLRRISNAHGPLVHELGEGLRQLVEDELNGPRLVETLNRAIDKKRERLMFRPAELIATDWRPAAAEGPASGIQSHVPPAP